MIHKYSGSELISVDKKSSVFLFGSEEVFKIYCGSTIKGPESTGQDFSKKITPWQNGPIKFSVPIRPATLASDSFGSVGNVYFNEQVQTLFFHDGIAANEIAGSQSNKDITIFNVLDVIDINQILICNTLNIDIECEIVYILNEQSIKALRFVVPANDIFSPLGGTNLRFNGLSDSILKIELRLIGQTLNQKPISSNGLPESQGDVSTYKDAVSATISFVAHQTVKRKNNTTKIVEELLTDEGDVRVLATANTDLNNVNTSVEVIDDTIKIDVEPDIRTYNTNKILITPLPYLTRPEMWVAGVKVQDKGFEGPIIREYDEVSRLSSFNLVELATPEGTLIDIQKNKLQVSISNEIYNKVWSGGNIGIYRISIPKPSMKPQNSRSNRLVPFEDPNNFIVILHDGRRLVNRPDDYPGLPNTYDFTVQKYYENTLQNPNGYTKKSVWLYTTIEALYTWSRFKRDLPSMERKREPWNPHATLDLLDTIESIIPDIDIPNGDYTIEISVDQYDFNDDFISTKTITVKTFDELKNTNDPEVPSIHQFSTELDIDTERVELRIRAKADEQNIWFDPTDSVHYPWTRPEQGGSATKRYIPEKGEEPLTNITNLSASQDGDNLVITWDDKQNHLLFDGYIVNVRVWRQANQHVGGQKYNVLAGFWGVNDPNLTSGAIDPFVASSPGLSNSYTYEFDPTGADRIEIRINKIKTEKRNYDTNRKAEIIQSNLSEEKITKTGSSFVEHETYSSTPQPNSDPATSESRVIIPNFDLNIADGFQGYRIRYYNPLAPTFSVLEWYVDSFPDTNNWDERVEIQDTRVQIQKGQNAFAYDIVVEGHTPSDLVVIHNNNAATVQVFKTVYVRGYDRDFTIISLLSKTTDPPTNIGYTLQLYSPSSFQETLGYITVGHITLYHVQ